ncbi:MAG: hypothetical protein ACK4MS_09655 [Paracoccaceae bacterium]
MMEYSAWNQWISEHQALVVAFGVPAITAIITIILGIFSSLQSAASARRDREASILLAISEYRLGTLNALSNDLTECLVLLFELKRSPREDSVVNLYRHSRKLFLTIDWNDPHSQNLLEALNLSLSGFLDMDSTVSRDGELEFQTNSMLLLGAARRHIENELRAYARFGHNKE